jgi:hypothetical protein
MQASELPAVMTAREPLLFLCVSIYHNKCQPCRLLPEADQDDIW